MMCPSCQKDKGFFFERVCYDCFFEIMDDIAPLLVAGDIDMDIVYQSPLSLAMDADKEITHDNI